MEKSKRLPKVPSLPVLILFSALILGIFLLIVYFPRTKNCVHEGKICVAVDKDGNPEATNLTPVEIPGMSNAWEANINISGKDHDSNHSRIILANVHLPTGLTYIELPVMVVAGSANMLSATLSIQQNGQIGPASPAQHLSNGLSTLRLPAPPDLVSSTVDLVITWFPVRENQLSFSPWIGKVAFASHPNFIAIDTNETVTPDVYDQPPTPSPTPFPTSTITPLPSPTATSMTPTPLGLGKLNGCFDLRLNKTEGFVTWPYSVKDGDNLLALATYFLGDPNRWKEIFYFNYHIIGEKVSEKLDEQEEIPRIFPGQLLFIPNVRSPFQHTVQAGENLAWIMTMNYGFGADSSWCTIYDMNASSIGPDPNNLQPATVITLYALAMPIPGEILALPGDRIVDYALGFYRDEAKFNSLCDANKKPLKEDCDVLLPFETIILPDLPISEIYVGLGTETWEEIAQMCYFETRPDYISAIQWANRRILGIFPDSKGPRQGQTIMLWNCR